MFIGHKSHAGLSEVGEVVLYEDKVFITLLQSRTVLDRERVKEW